MSPQAISSDPANVQSTLWLIDDDPALRLILADTFSDAQLNVVSFTQAKAAWIRLNDMLQSGDFSAQPDVILTDIRMPLMDGLSFSDWVHKTFPELPIIIMTAHSDLQSAVDSYQTGAFDYLPKPFDLDDAVTIIKKAIKPRIKPSSAPDPSTADPSSADPSIADSSTAQSLLEPTDQSTPSAYSSPLSDETNPSDPSIAADKTAHNQPSSKNTQKTAKSTPKRKNSTSVNRSSTIVASSPSHKTSTTTARSHSKRNANKLKSTTDNSSNNPNGIIGQSVAMQTVFRAIGRLSHSPITVLITGESGTGKELVANALHQHSPRQHKPFIALNMAAIPHDLIESELFGHEKGAFTGASTQRQGRFEQANGGTLFLDEIGDMPFSTQTRLLRVLANGEFYRVGGQQPIKVDVRIIAATHQNLEHLVKLGKFREDLFYRLNVIRLPLPPLRDRPEDIPALVDHFMHRAAKEMDTEQKYIDPQALAIMQAFDWSGNVRQIENVCRWLTVMATGDVVLAEDLPPELLDFVNQHSNSHLQANDPAPLTVDNNIEQASINPDSSQLSTSSVSAEAVTSPLATAPTAYPNVESITKLSNPPMGQSPLNDLDASQPSTLGNQSTASHHLASHDAIDPNNDAATANLSWQQALAYWAKQALARGDSEILQLASPEFERVLLEVALEHTNGRKGDAAALLGWGRNTLTRKLKQLDIQQP